MSRHKKRKAEKRYRLGMEEGQALGDGAPLHTLHGAVRQAARSKNLRDQQVRRGKRLQREAADILHSLETGGVHTAGLE